MEAFQRERESEPIGHLYSRECCANTWYAIGVCRMLLGEKAAAEAAFSEAEDNIARAVEVVAAAIATAPPGNAAWVLPIEPLLGVRHARPAWVEVLTELRSCAA